MRRLNLINQRFDRLLVKEFSHCESEAYWKCLCDCGNEILVRTQHLKSGQVGSCGCRRRDLMKNINTKIDTNWRNYYRAYKKSADKRGLNFNLTLEDLKSLCVLPCYYCGNTSEIKSLSRMKLVANGIDRIDSTLGYTLENCVPCCSFCNYSKRNLSPQEFLDHINKIYNYQHQGQQV